ncbi:MAG: phosphoenolpyruvate carboxykinase [Acidimicrobiales bacterium]|nr:phosphoenolpyruvate carboxykinase [Acidimicrobiales bacterium]
MERCTVLDLSYLGIHNVANVFHNLSTPQLYEEAIRRREATVAHLGPLVVRTGQYTGRSADDKFIVREPSSEDRVWWGKHNRPFEPDDFARLKLRLGAYLQGRDVYVQDCYAGADPEYRLKIRVLTETAWHNMFARDMLLREFDKDVLEQFAPEFTVIHCPQFHAIPDVDHTRSEAFILLNFGENLVIIGGTSYAGEIKKSVFTVMNYLLPQKGVLGMHCSANQGSQGDTALFFGLSGTGKTTLSADPDRALIGDDEHGWSDNGIFNFEGGCYAKVIRLSREAEPEIYETTRRFGTILENVTIDHGTRRLDLDDGSLTENTRAAYPITHLPNIVRDGIGPHPKNVVMLTADAFGVLPPIARLTRAQAMYHFLSGYTAKVAGTERGVTEPSATFSTLFGAPFMALHPTVYAELFGERIDRHEVTTWLVNTGWTGGPYGTGERIRIAYSRAVIAAALAGALDDVATTTDPTFGFEAPQHCPGVPDELLWPRNTWADQDAYDAQARHLAELFTANFAQFADQASPEVRAAGPVAG